MSGRTENGTKTVRILIADDHAEVRRALRRLIGDLPGFNVCGEAESGQDAIAQAAKLQPDLILMDVSMGPVSGIDATREILKFAPQTGIVILTMHDNSSVLQDAMAAGVKGYVLKSDTNRDLLTAIETVAGSGTFFTARVAHPASSGGCGEPGKAA